MLSFAGEHQTRPCAYSHFFAPTRRERCHGINRSGVRTAYRLGATLRSRKCARQALDREFSVHDGDDDAPVTLRFRAVDDEQVAVVQVRVLHGIPLHMGKEGGGGMSLFLVVVQLDNPFESTIALSGLVIRSLLDFGPPANRSVAYNAAAWNASASPPD